MAWLNAVAMLNDGSWRLTLLGNYVCVPAAIMAMLNMHKLHGGLHVNGKEGTTMGRPVRMGVSNSQCNHTIKSSLSTQNLHGIFGKGAGLGTSPKSLRVGKPMKMQYMVETWCDALMFPHPQFHAHVVSPPASPMDGVMEGERNKRVVPRVGEGRKSGEGNMGLRMVGAVTGAL